MESFINEYALDELNEEVTVQEYIAEAHQQKYIADQMYDEAINSDECVDIELIWNAVDDYKAAIIKSHDRDLEVEAECISKMATIFEKILFLKDLARRYHYKCLELAESMKPKTFYHRTWFIKSKRAVERYQRETVEEEDRVKNEKREKVADKIKPMIQEINEKFRSLTHRKFLEFIYEKFPPKKIEQKLDQTLLENSLKKCYRNAASHYHTDKNSEELYGLEWYFICEETCKLINNRYETFKGLDE